MDDGLIDSLCGNHKLYREIMSWLINFDYNKKISNNSCIIVSGDNCIGKTYSINAICNHLNYEITTIDNNNCYSSAQLKDIIYKKASSSLVQILTNNIRNKVIIIDNFDSIFIADKTINTSLLKLLNEGKIKNIPIICITNNDIIKKMGEIKKSCKIYYLTKPNYNDIELILIKKNIKNINKLYKSSDGNLDKIFNDIENNNNIYNDIIDDYTDMNILYYNNPKHFNREKIEKLIIKDSWMIPLKFHENLIKDLENRNCTCKKINEFYKNFMEIICIYDYYMFKNNTDISISIFASYIYFLSFLKYKKEIVMNMGNFTKILSYLSLQKKNNKLIYNQGNFPYYQISNYHINLCNRKFISFN